MTIMENTINTIKQLNDCITAYSIFSLDFFNRPSDYIMKHFHPLILNLKRHRAKAINEFSLPKTKDLETEWTNYLINPNPSDAEIKRIIRLGLSVSGLEDELEFRNLIQRQEPQRILFKWLNSYVWRFQILNSEYNFKNDFWLELVENWISLLNSSKIKIPNLSEKHSLIFDFKDYKARKSHKEYYDKEAAEIFSLLENERIPEDKLLETVRDKISNKFYIDFFPSDPFLDDILARYFTYLLEKYLNDRSRLDLLRALLYNCTNPLTLKGCERFIKLFKSIEANINEREKNEIKIFTKNKLGDPRINKSEWQVLKENDEKIYKKIRYWFNEQDFNLFFEFVFAGAVDPHGRKECWQRYLYDADDFRIFLPNQNKINEFKRLSEKKDIDLFIEPILNTSGVTSFVIKIDEIFIIETKETGNASYVYDVGYIRNKSELDWKSGEKTVKYFYEEIFREDGDYIKKIPSKDYTKYETLAPDGKNEISFQKSRHWRFTHDQHYNWHRAVTIMMMQLHGLYPKDPKTGEEIKYA
jgi:hypothetical protein